DGKHVATGSHRGNVQVWELPSGKPLTDRIRRPGVLRHLAFGPGDDTLVVVTDLAYCLGGYKPDAVTGKPLKQFAPLQARQLDSHMASALSPDGRSLWVFKTWPDPSLVIDTGKDSAHPFTTAEGFGAYNIKRTAFHPTGPRVRKGDPDSVGYDCLA